MIPEGMMTLEQGIANALTLHSDLLRLDFGADNLYFSPIADGPLTAVAVTARAQGREFLAVCGRVPHTLEQVAAAWEAATKRWNASPQEERERICETSGFRQHRVSMLLALREQGFTFPIRTRAN
jgi:hypothetical protein